MSAALPIVDAGAPFFDRDYRGSKSSTYLVRLGDEEGVIYYLYAGRNMENIDGNNTVAFYKKRSDGTFYKNRYTQVRVSELTIISEINSSEG